MTGLAITGVTGAVGGAVAAELAAAGAALILVARDATRAPALEGSVVREVPSYGDSTAMRKALDGANTLFMVSARESADRLDQHRRAVDAAVAAGVGRIVYLSFLAAAPDATFTFARDHFHTEEHIRASGLAYTFLRPSLYADFVPGLVRADGAIAGPAGDGAIAWVARADVASSAASVLKHDGHEGRTYDLTGPRAWTMAETAALLGARYVSETMEEAYASRAHYAAPEWEVAGWVTSYVAIATGEMNVVSDSVQALTGREAASLETVLGR